MGTTYLRIITVFSLGTLGYMCLEKIVMGTGKTTITMVCQLAGALTNIVLDPVMIYGLFGCPAMGVAGAAWATVIGQFVSLIVIAAVYFKKGVGLESGMRHLRPEKKTLGSIYAIGLPAIVMQILTLIISLLRFVVLALPLAWALSLTENAANLVWISLPVAEAGACLVAVLLTRRTYLHSL